jgi:hypothetical protein
MALTNNTITTILIDVGSSSKLIEAKAAGTIYPGYLITYTSATVSTVEASPENADGEQKYVMVALEGTDNGRTVDDPYLIGETVKGAILRSGDVFYVRLRRSSPVNMNAQLAQMVDVPPAPGRIDVAFTNNQAICFAYEAAAAGVEGRLISAYVK